MIVLAAIELFTTCMPHMQSKLEHEKLLWQHDCFIQMASSCQHPELMAHMVSIAGAIHCCYQLVEAHGLAGIVGARY
jgi:hypothetical protein